MKESEVVKDTLSKPGVHFQWESDFRTKDNEHFYNLAFDRIARVLKAPAGSRILDVGCGAGFHSIRLAKRGFTVTGVDFSAGVLDAGREVAAKLDLPITFQREDVLALTFKDSTFDYILVWGVLMHIPDVEGALRELDRVLKPGGFLVISEGNESSAQSFFMEGLKKLLKKGDAEAKPTPAGTEYWTKTKAGELMTRQANISWLKRWFKERGYKVRSHFAGQFTEVYTRFKSRLIQSAIHAFNGFWFRFIRWPRPAFANIVIVRKP